MNEQILSKVNATSSSLGVFTKHSSDRSFQCEERECLRGALFSIFALVSEIDESQSAHISHGLRQAQTLTLLHPVILNHQGPDLHARSSGVVSTPPCPPATDPASKMLELSSAI